MQCQWLFISDRKLFTAYIQDNSGSVMVSKLEKKRGTSGSVMVSKLD